MWHGIDWDEGRINLQPEQTKEERSKSMILNDECLTEFLTIKENCDKTKKGIPLSKFVFHGPAKKNAKLNERQYYLKWYEVCENLGFLDFSKIKKDGKPKALYLPHDFRHTRVVDNENARVPRGLTKMQTGHKNDMMLEYYDTKPQEHQEMIIDMQENYYKKHRKKTENKKTDLKKKIEEIRNNLDYWVVDLPEKVQNEFKGLLDSIDEF